MSISNCQRRLSPLRRQVLALLGAAFVGAAFLGTAQAATTGAFETDVAIEATPYHGLEPHLRFIYDSQRGNGPLGVGWNLAGLSRIERRSTTSGVPAYNAEDRFYLDGNELIRCPTDPASPYAKRASCKYPSPGSTPYTAKVETFQKIFRDASGQWQVLERNGTRRWFAAAASEASWHVARVEDLHGSGVDYHYASAPGAAESIAQIDYTGTSIIFHWRARADVISRANGKLIERQSDRLASVEVRADGQMARTYALSYSTRPLTGESSIASIQEFGRDASIDGNGVVHGSAHPAHRYTYAGDAPSTSPTWIGAVKRLSDATAVGSGAAAPPQFAGVYLAATAANPCPLGKFRELLTGDFDGDGRSDMVAVQLCKLDHRMEIRLNQFRAPNVVDRGGVEIALDETYATYLGENDTRSDLFRTFVADTNGDGRQDIVVLSWRPSTNDLRGPLELLVDVALSDGQGGFHWAHPDFRPTGWVTPDLTQERGPQCAVGDFAGTRRLELSCIFQDHDGNQFLGRTAARRDGSLVPQAPTLMAPAAWPLAPGVIALNTPQLVTGDVNGDGLADLMVSSYDRGDVAACANAGDEKSNCAIHFELMTGISNGITFDFAYAPTPWLYAMAGDRTSLYSADVDGDRRADYLLILGDPAPVHPTPGDPAFPAMTEVATAIGPTLPSFHTATQALPPGLVRHQATVALGDVDGDGATDLLVLNQVPVWSGIGCRADGIGHPVLTRVASKRDGQFAMPARWDDCTTAHEVPLPSDELMTTIGGYRAADSNGDGLADFMLAFQHWNSSLNVWEMAVIDDVSKPTGLDTTRWGLTDVNGDGRPDLQRLQFNGASIQLAQLVQQPDGGFALKEALLPTFDNPAVGAWKFGDVNGDGRIDAVHLGCVRTLGARGCALVVDTFLAEAGGGFRRLATATSQNGQLLGLAEANLAAWRLMDTNGDGHLSLVFMSARSPSLPGVYLHTLTFTDRWVDQPVNGPFSLGSDAAHARALDDVLTWFVADIDGDGHSDLVHLVSNLGSNEVTVLRSLGDNRWVLSDFNLDNPVGDWLGQYAGAQSPTRWHSLDVNHDGLSDLVRTLATPNGVVVQTLLSVGDGTWKDATAHLDLAQAPEARAAAGRNDWSVSNASLHAAPRLTRVDRLGDAKAVVSQLSVVAPGRWTVSRDELVDPARAEVRSRPSWAAANLAGDSRIGLLRIDASADGAALDVASIVASAAPDLLTQVQTPLGGRIDIAYGSYAAFQPLAPADPCALPLGFALDVVTSTTTSDGRADGTRTTETRDYRCPRWMGSSRLFAGWSELDTFVPATSNRDAVNGREAYGYSDDCGVWLRERNQMDGQRRPIVFRTSVFVPPSVQAPWDCLPYRVVNQTMNDATEPPLMAYRNFGYDVFGNATSITRGGGAVDGGGEALTTAVFHPNTDAWIVAAPAKVELRDASFAIQPLLRQRRYCYDHDESQDCSATPSLGELTRQNDLVDAAQPTGRVTRFGHDEAGNVTSVRNANGHESGITYDPYHRVFPTLFTDALGRTTAEIDWDPVLVKPHVIRVGTAAPAVLDYDALGHLKSTLLPSGGVVQRQYLNEGDPERQSIRQTALDSSFSGLWSEALYDGLGRSYRFNRKSSNWFGHYERDIVYGDSTGLPRATTGWHCGTWWPFCSPHHAVRETYAYDMAGRLKQQNHADATSINVGYRNEGTAAVIDRADELSVSSTALRDVFGRLQAIRGMADGQTATSSYHYDAADELVRTVDPMGNATGFERNLSGELTTLTDPDLGTRVIGRDDVGNITSIEDAKHNLIRYTYDELERLKTKLVVADQRLLTLVYDEPNSGPSRGRMTSLIDSAAVDCPGFVSKRWTYDAAGALAGTTACVNGVTHSHGFGHDLLGRLHSVTYPDQTEVFYGYDRAGRPDVLTGVIDKIRYDASNRPRSIRYANGMRSSFTYERDRQALQSEAVALGARSVFDAQYTYYGNQLLKSVASPSNRIGLNYTYDGLSRLATVRGQETADYQYDLAGNLTFRTGLGALGYVPQGPAGCSTGGQPAVACATPHAVQTAGPYTFHYDANGAAAVVDRGASEHRSIEWNADHDAQQVTDFDHTVTRYAYDGFGRRITRESNGQTHRWFGKLSEQEANAGLVKNYFIGGRKMASAGAGGMTWIAADRLDTVRAVSDGSGAVVPTAGFDPYGTANAATDPRQFAGHELEPNLPLIFMGARLYDPAIGRFLSPDPVIPSLLHTQALNRYAYAFNNPLSFVDPSGHDPLGISAPYQDGAEIDWFGSVVPTPLLEAGQLSASSPPISVTTQVNLPQGTVVPSTMDQIGAYPPGQVGLMALSKQMANDFNANPVVRLVNAISKRWTNEPMYWAKKGGGYIEFDQTQANSRELFSAMVGAVPIHYLFYLELGPAESELVALTTETEAVATLEASEVLQGEVTSGAGIGEAVNIVYRATDVGTGETIYVGITNNLDRRLFEHMASKGIYIEQIPGLNNLMRADAQAVEQVLIEKYGLAKNGGSLMNKINSIAVDNPVYGPSIERGRELLQSVGFPGF